MSEKSKSAKKATASSIKLGSEVFKLGDTVLVRSDAANPYVGVIREIIDKGGKKSEFLLNWFYRPEEAMGGRKEFHGERELFESDHKDWVSGETIVRKCHVYTMKKYQELKVVGRNDFYSRFTYLPKTHEFRPDRVPVFCSCEMPYNPDQLMIMCEICQDWFHPLCQKYDVEAGKDDDSFSCLACSSKSQTKGLPAHDSPASSAQTASNAKKRQKT